MMRSELGLLVAWLYLSVSYMASICFAAHGNPKDFAIAGLTLALAKMLCDKVKDDGFRF